MKKLTIITLFLVIANSEMQAREGFFSLLNRYCFTHKYFSRYELYEPAFFENENNKNKILNDEEYYLSLIEDSIDKRLYVGQKAHKTIHLPKIIQGLSELIGLGGIVAGWYYFLEKNYDLRITIPVSVISAFILTHGLAQIYKGAFYKKRMQAKLERDLVIREKLRDITNQLPVLE